VTRALAGALGLALALVAGAPDARADDAAEAKARYRKGADLYRAGKFHAAIAEFEAAYRLKPHGAIHFNVAQCRERLAEWPGAHRAYADYLREVPDAKDRAAVRASMKKIEARLAAAGVQALLVYTDPPGAEVRLDDRPRGTTPLHFVVPPGTYALALTLDGYDPVKQEIALAADSARTVDLVLRPARPPPAPSAAVIAALSASVAPGTPPGAAPAPPAAASPPGPATRPAAPAEAQASKAVPDLTVKPPSPAAPLVPRAPGKRPGKERPRLYTWIAAGAAGVALAAGAYYGYSASQDEDALHGMVDPDGAAARKYASDAKSKAKTANVLYAVSGAAAAAGVTLFFVEKRF